MSVRELIKLLETMPQDAPAVIVVSQERRYSEHTSGDEDRQFEVARVYDLESRIVIEGENGEWI